MLLTPEAVQLTSLAEAVGVVRQLKVLLVTRLLWHRTVVWHGLSQLVVCLVPP
jgi:hypothetical protein